MTVAVKTAELFSRVGQASFQSGERVEGFAALRKSLLIMQKLFDYPLTDEQLRTIRDQLRGTLTALRELPAHQVTVGGDAERGPPRRPQPTTPIVRRGEDGRGVAQRQDPRPSP